MTIEQIVAEFREKFPISIDYPPPINEMEVFTQMEIDRRVNRAKAIHAKQESFLRTAYEAGKAEGVNENTSDGYHTFKELYEFRLLYNAHLFSEWAKQGKYDVHKSQRHYDGELCFGREDYFVVVATLPTGQISNHYPMSDWELFNCEAVEKAKAQWDAHSSQDVAKRLRNAISIINETK